MQRRFDYYGDDALEFKPERWEALRPGWVRLPQAMHLSPPPPSPSPRENIHADDRNRSISPSTAVPVSASVVRTLHLTHPFAPAPPLLETPTSPPLNKTPTANKTFTTEQFALTEASYTTIRLLQHFQSIEARDPRPWQEQMTLTCSIHQGALVGLAPM